MEAENSVILLLGTKAWPTPVRVGPALAQPTTLWK